MPQELIRLAIVLSITGLSRSSVYELISKNQFPKQVRLGSLRSAAWVRSEVEQWVDERIAERDGNAA